MKNSQPVELILTDTSGNTSEYKTTLYISKIKQLVQVEASHEMLDVSEFKPNVTAQNLDIVSGPTSLTKVGKI